MSERRSDHPDVGKTYRVVKVDSRLPDVKAWEGRIAECVWVGPANVGLRLRWEGKEEWFARTEVEEVE